MQTIINTVELARFLPIFKNLFFHILKFFSSFLTLTHSSKTETFVETSKPSPHLTLYSRTCCCALKKRNFTFVDILKVKLATLCL